MNILDTIARFDGVIAKGLNAVSAMPITFNRVVVLLSEANYLKVAPFVLVAVWFWNAEPREENRRKVSAGFIAILLAIAIGRALQLALPLRPRPIHTPDLGLMLPAGMNVDILGGWSSFPSDHAVVFGALVGLAWALSRRLGKAGLLYAIVMVLLPRIYLGVHYLSDILAGLTIGLAVSWLAQIGLVSRLLSFPVEPLARRYPAFFYTSVMFILTQVVQMFGDVRRIASIAKGVASGTL